MEITKEEKVVVIMNRISGWNHKIDANVVDIERLAKLLLELMEKQHDTH